MKIIFLHLSLTLIIGLRTKGQSVDEFNKLNTCAYEWKYLNLTSTLEGKIIFFCQPSFYCGEESNASTAIIVTAKGDTIRILQECDFNPIDSPMRLKPMDNVEIKPYSQDMSSYKPDDIIADPYSCLISTASWGIVAKKEEHQ